MPPASGAPARPWRLAAGIAVALAGHLPASGLWLVSFYTFVVYATPDSWFLTDCCVMLMQLVLFIGCVVPGVRLVRRGQLGIGLGLLIGWATGIFGLVAGTAALIALTAAAAS